MRFHVSLYVLIAGFYLLTGSGRIGLSDSVAMLHVAQSVVNEGSLSAEPCDPNWAEHANHCVLGKNGRYYSSFGLVPSFVAVPAIVGAKIIATILHVDSVAVAKTSVSLLTVLISPLVCVVLAMWIRKLGYSLQTAAIAAGILAFASPFWHFAVKGFYSEPYFVLALLLAAYLLSCPGIPYARALSGLAFGIACGCRVVGVILFPAFLVCLALHSRERRASAVSFFREAVYFTATTSFCFLLIAWANYARFGSPLKTGYQAAFSSTAQLLSTPLSHGLRKLLFSGEVGLVVFAPWVLLAIVCFPAFVRAHPAESVLCGLIFVFNLIFFGRTQLWHAGWVAGPRYLLPTLPFLLMALVPHIEGLRQQAVAEPSVLGLRRSMATGLLLSLVLVGFSIQALGLLYPDQRYYELMGFYEYNEHRPAKSWWAGSIPFASLDFLCGLVKETQPTAKAAGAVFAGPINNTDPEEVRRTAITSTARSDEEFLRSLPNPENLILPDLLFVKVHYLGFPAALAYAYVGLSILMGAAGVIGIRKYAVRT